MIRYVTMYHIELLEVFFLKKRKMILHRIHLHNANKLLFSVGSGQCQAVGMCESGMCYMALCATQKQSLMVPPSPGWQKLVFVTSYRSLTLMIGVQIRYHFCQISGHTVRSDGGGMVYHLDTGRELKWQPEYRDLLSIQYLNPLAPQIHHTRTDLAKDRVFLLIQSFYQPNQRSDQESESCQESILHIHLGAHI